MKWTSVQRLERRAELTRIIRSACLRSQFAYCPSGDGRAHSWFDLVELRGESRTIFRRACRRCDLEHWRQVYITEHDEEVIEAEGFDAPKGFPYAEEARTRWRVYKLRKLVDRCEAASGRHKWSIPRLESADEGSGERWAQTCAVCHRMYFTLIASGAKDESRYDDSLVDYTTIKLPRST